MKFTLAVVWLYREKYRALWQRPSGLALMLGIGVFVLWALFAPRTGELPDGLNHASPRLKQAWLASRALGAVFFVPFAEELAFRGFLQRRLLDENFTEVAQGRFTY